MNSFIQFVRNYFILLFWTLLIGSFITAYVQLKDKVNLANDTAKHGIVSLELGFTNKGDSSIIGSWKQDSINRRLNTPPISDSNWHQDKTRAGLSSIVQYGKYTDKIALAKHDISIDFIFIFFYTFLAIVIITRLQSLHSNTRKLTNHTRLNAFLIHVDNLLNKPGISNYLLFSALIAGICDVLENFGMLYLLHHAPGIASFYAPATAFFTSLAASIKFIILIALLVYLLFKLFTYFSLLKQLSDVIKIRARQLYQYRVIVLGVLFFSLPVWILDQGQDLLININTSDKGIIIFLITLVIAAFLNWYLAKLFFSPIKKYGDFILPLRAPNPPATSSAAEKRVSRFLGASTIIIPAVAILNAVYAIRIFNWMSFLTPFVWLMLFLLIFFLIIRYDSVCFVFNKLSTRLSQKQLLTGTIVLFVVLGLIIPTGLRLFVFQNNIGTPYVLIYLFWHCIFLAICFVIFVSLRENFTFSWWQKWSGPNIGIPILTGGFLLFGLFLFVNVFPKLITNMDAIYLGLPVVLTGIVFYILVFTILIRYSIKKSINFVFFLIVISIIVTVVSDNPFHDVQQIPATTVRKVNTLEQYFHDWIIHRSNEIDTTDTTKEYPVFLVNTYGGGIRAAAFTSMTLTYLDSLMMHEDTVARLPFEHYIFSISGASGGTIGAAVQCAYYAKNLKDTTKYNFKEVDSFYRQDFLTPILACLLGRDVWASISATHWWKDRSAIQENIWATKAYATYHINLQDAYDTYWDHTINNPVKYEVPLLFANTLNVDDGLKGICAPVVLKDTDFPATRFIRNEWDSGKTVSLITGAFLSARFPFISPSGKLIGPGSKPGGQHYIDGGGKDNSGAGTSASIFLNIVRNIHRASVEGKDTEFIRLCKHLRFYFVSISNSSHTIEEERNKVGFHFEPASPLIGIINSGINGNAHAADSTLQFVFGAPVLPLDSIKTGYFQVWPTEEYFTAPDKKPMEALLPLGWQISDSSLSRLQRTFSPSNIQKTNDAIGLKRLMDVCKRQSLGSRKHF
jgi:hypothetical protein